MAIEGNSSLKEYMNIVYLTPETAVFDLTPGGFLSLELGDVKYARVSLHRAFPFTNDMEYISVKDPEDKEIGIIRDLREFPSRTVELFFEEIDRRYFSPVIRSISSIKDEMGYAYWEVATDAGACRFTAKIGTGSIVPVGRGRLLITDVDGSRYEIQDYNSLDEKSLKKLEPYL